MQPLKLTVYVMGALRENGAKMKLPRLDQRVTPLLVDREPESNRVCTTEVPPYTRQADASIAIN